MGNFSLQSLLVPAFFLLVNYELYNLSWRGIQGITLKIIPQAKALMTENLFEWLHQKPYRDFQNRLSGTYARQITLLSDAFERLFGNVFIRLIRGSVQLAMALLLMGWIHPLFSFIFLLWTIFFVSLSFFFSKKIRRLSESVAEKQGDVSGQIVDSLGSGKEVRVFGQIPYESLRIHRGLERFKKAYKERGVFFLKQSLLH